MVDKITVNGPLGLKVNFPVGTDAQTVSTVMDQAYKKRLDERAGEYANQIEAVQGQAGAGSLFKNMFGLDLEAKTAGVASGAMEALTGGKFNEGYAVANRAVQIMQDRARERTGALGTAAEVGGALASGGLFRAPAAPTAVGRIAQGAKAGAVYGAGYGLGGSDETSVGGLAADVGQEALRGAGFGAGIGTAFEAGRGLINGGRALVRGAQSLAQSPQQRAAQAVTKSLAEDDVTVAQAMRRAGRKPSPNSPQMGLVDVAGQNTLGLARAVSAQPGEARTIMNRFLQPRDRTASLRVGAEVGDAIGDAGTYAQRLNGLMGKRAQDAEVAYGAAFQQAKPLDTRGLIVELDTEIARSKGGIKDGLSKFRNLLVREEKVPVPNVGMEPKFITREVPETDLEVLHQVKIAADDLLARNPIKESSLDKTAKYRVGQYYQKLMGIMAPEGSAYGAAKAQFAQQSQLMDALKAGDELFSFKQYDELADAVAGMSTSERELFRIGASRAIKERLSTASDSRDVVKLVSGSKALRRALRLAFPDSASYRKFTTNLLMEAKAKGTKRYIKDISQTAVVQAEREAASDFGEFVGTATDLATANGTGLVQRAASAIGQQLRLTPEVATEVARILTAKDPQTYAILLQNAQKRLAGTPKLDAVLDALSRLRGPATSAAAGSGNR